MSTEATRVQQIVNDIDLNILGTTMRVEVGDHFTKGVYLQVACHRRDTYTGAMEWGHGGTAYLSYGADEAAIVAIAFGLVKAYVEHEAREGYTYQGLRVYGPHMTLEALKQAARTSAPEPVEAVEAVEAVEVPWTFPTPCARRPSPSRVAPSTTTAAATRSTPAGTGAPVPTSGAPRMPSHYPIPTEQVRRFRLALCEHLGLDPAVVSGENFHVEFTGDDHGTVSLVAFVSGADLVRLFNEAARPTTSAPEGT
jgi:hypothetical protein